MCARKARGRRKQVESDSVTCDATPVLMVVHGENLGKSYPLDKPSTIIGSEATVDIRIEHESVSPVHAEVAKTEDGLRIRDRRSHNGTFVNGRLATEGGLTHGDRLKVGRTIFKIFCEGDVEHACQEETGLLVNQDGLTGLHTKRSFHDSLEQELRRCLRYGRELSVFIYGIDNLETVERKISLMACDALLVQVSEVVSENLRRDDYHARYGEEEFAVLLPEINQAEALMQAEKLRESIEQTEFVWKGKIVPTTISIGVATFEKTMEDAEDFILEIERNLYQSTKSGRNRVIGVEGGVTRCG